MKKINAPKATQLPSGSWFCRVRMKGIDQCITAPTKKEAERAALAVKEGFIQKQNEPMTVAKAYEKYIEAKEGVLSPSTIAGYKCLSANTFQELMPLRLDALNQKIVQTAVSNMARSKSPKYVRNAYGLFTAVLSMFYPSLELNTRMPQKQKIEKRIISDTEIQKIMQAVKGSEIELPVLMGMWMGMRMSEVIGADYQDIHGNTLNICRALVKDYDGKLVEKSPKSYAGFRKVEIPDYILGLMKKTGNTTGKIVRLSGSTIYERFCDALERNNIAHCKFHDLRHANAAVMARLGVEAKYAMARNGWETEQMYNDVYSYVMDDKMQEVNARIDDYFLKKMGAEPKKRKQYRIVRGIENLHKQSTSDNENSNA